jgi:uncharacterized protein YkwD
VPRNLLQTFSFLLGLWLALALLLPLAAVGGSDSSPALAALEAHLYEGANQIRDQHHRIRLVRSTALDRVARAHSADMAARGYLAHENPEGENPVDRIERGGVSGFLLAAENAGTTNRRDPVQEILEGWKLSPVHRRNLLAPAFNTTGVGTARASDGTLYFTQLYLTFAKE